jgi:hypothetical protein
MAESVSRHGVGAQITIGGEPQRTVVGFPGDTDLVTKSYAQQSFAEDGILFNGSMFMCARHNDEDIERTVRAFDRTCETIASGTPLRPLLAGAPVAPVFREP